jgi:hypothetical protein
MKLRKLILTAFVLSVFTATMCAYGQEAQGKDDAKSKSVQMEKQLKIKDDEHNFHLAVAPSTDFPFSYARKDVLVIPSSEISSEKLGEITEDMAVMNRILDKQIPERTVWMFQSSRSVFIEDYGAIFVINVDFPILPVKEVPSEDAKESDKDPLWEETKRELQSPGFPGIVLPHPMPFGDNSSKKYDKEKVDALRSNLIKSLKHAANIRALKNDDMVIVTASGAGQGSGEAVLQSIVIKSGDSSVVKQSSPGRSAASSAGVLTIRAKKSDIDAFAKDELNFEQFTAKVSVLTY